MYKTIKIIVLMLISTSAFATTYYVSPLGNNANKGTSVDQPFMAVQYAIDKMKTKDTLIVLDGFYTGRITLKSGITILAKNPRKVVFSGATAFKGNFEKYSGNIYKVKIGSNPKQLFYKNEPMTWAQWPNIQWSENWDASKKWKSAAKGTGPGVLTCDAFSEIKDLDLRGGYCFLRYSKGNSCYSRAIKSFNGSTLYWDDANFYSTPYSGEDGRRGSVAAMNKGKAKADVNARFFLAGALSLLDSEGEWFAKDGILYFYAPKGAKPNADDFLITTNEYSILNADVIADVKIEGVDFFATSIMLDNPSNKRIMFYNDYFTYIGADPLFVDNLLGKKTSKPIYVVGAEVGFDKCLFAGAQNTALQLDGSQLVVNNCVFAENNRNANFQSVALLVKAKGTFSITRNTFFNNCSDAIRIGFEDNTFMKSENPNISYNNICNAGIYNSDVSGVYMPNLSQQWTDFHHNWVHNVKGNGVRLDQAGEKLTVHHNVFWASLRGMNIEGYGNFNIYNNTSVLNAEACFITRNVVSKRKGVPVDAHVSNDLSFPPIDDWNILNNLVEEFVDRIGPSEKGPFQESKNKKTLNAERAKNNVIPITDRGAIQGNLTGFNAKRIFIGGSLADLNLIPKDKIVENGIVQTLALKNKGVTALDSFRGAYNYGEKGWFAGSDWMPFGLDVLKTMAQSEQFAKKYHSVSIVPKINVLSLINGH